MLLLAALVAYVLGAMPVRTPKQRADLLLAHQRCINFIIAEKMAARLLPSPPTRWSSGLQCLEIGHGVWYAAGVVGLNGFDEIETPVPWKAVFVPATGQPLFLSLGSRSEGDWASALRAAGVEPKPVGKP